MKEIEILMEVKSSKEDALKALAEFDFKGEKKVLDIYFTSQFCNNLQPDKNGHLSNCYRLRLKDDQASIAYKIDHFDDLLNWTHSDEYETGVDDFDIALRIHKQLGFEELIRINNRKYTYLTEKYEIILEDVENLGLFLEVENLDQVPDSKVFATKEEIRNFIKTLNIEFGKEQNSGKPELMLKKINNF